MTENAEFTIEQQTYDKSEFMSFCAYQKSEITKLQVIMIMMISYLEKGFGDMTKAAD